MFILFFYQKPKRKNKNDYCKLFKVVLEEKKEQHNKVVFRDNTGVFKHHQLTFLNCFFVLIYSGLGNFVSPRIILKESKPYL
jgi:hypothetical protein